MFSLLLKDLSFNFITEQPVCLEEDPYDLQSFIIIQEMHRNTSKPIIIKCIFGHFCNEPSMFTILLYRGLPYFHFLDLML